MAWRHRNETTQGSRRSSAQAIGRFRHAVDDDQLSVILTRNSSAKETAVVGLIEQNVLVTPGNVGAMRVSRVEEGAVGEDPEDVVRIAVRELFDRTPTSGETQRQEREPGGRILTRERAQGQHGRSGCGRDIDTRSGRRGGQ